MSSKKLLIRNATRDDCHELSLLKQAVWRTTYTGIYPQEKLDGYDVAKNTHIFETIVQNPDITLFVAEDQGKLVGFMTVGKPFKLFNEYDQEVGLLYIRKDYQRKGLGRQFLKKAESEVVSKGYSSFIVSVNTRNSNAIAFYQAMGGRIIHEDEDQKRLIFEIK